MTTPADQPDLADPPPLLPAVARGDAAAVRRCIERYAPLVYGVARRACRSDADAEDVTQDTFVDLWRRAGNYDPAGGSEAAFVATVARRRLIDHVRRAGRREPSCDMLEVDHGQNVPPAFDDEAEAAREAMAAISCEQRRVLSLSIFDGQTYAEIGERLAMPLSTVKSHARRGLASLREALELRRQAVEVRRKQYRSRRTQP